MNLIDLSSTNSIGYFNHHNNHLNHHHHHHHQLLKPTSVATSSPPISTTTSTTVAHKTAQSTSSTDPLVLLPNLASLMPFSNTNNTNNNSSNKSNVNRTTPTTINLSPNATTTSQKILNTVTTNYVNSATTTPASLSGGGGHYLDNENDLKLFPNITNTSYSYTSSSGGGGHLSSDANKAFDDVVFDILKVDPDDIAGQLTLIDLPLFKAIEPDELISCKWMSREKLIKAPNIVQFTRRFNQTTFWCQKEILNCKRIETRGKMITHFIKICKRLNELHSFNSLMAIIVALKAAPIYRLKKTWSQHVSKRDMTTFERLADLMFDTSDNKRKMRDMHMNCKLPCIPFLGLFLTDLIHIDIAHPHNSFDNPQRRNQMNNICRLISEYQQSNYQDLSSLSCSCCFQTTTTQSSNSNSLNNTNDQQIKNDSISNCIISNCNCAIHHGHGYGAGIINNDGTIYISEITYVKNYLNSFLYIEELQKFKEDENYRDSLELEPEPNTEQLNQNQLNNNKLINDSLALPSIHFSTSSPGKLANVGIVSNSSSSSSSSSSASNQTNDIKRFNKLANFHSSHHPNQQQQQLNDSNSKTPSLFNAQTTTTNQSQSQQTQIQQQQHRKTLSLASSLFNSNNNNNNNNLINETKDLLNDLKLKHPLDDSIVEPPVVNCITSPTSTKILTNTPTTTSTSTSLATNNTNNLTNSQLIMAQCLNTSNNLTQTNTLTNNNNNCNTTNPYIVNTTDLIINDLSNLLQQKQLLNSVKINDPSSLLKELLKYRYNVAVQNGTASAQPSTKSSSHHHHHHHVSSTLKNKFNCYSSSSADVDDESDDYEAANLTGCVDLTNATNNNNNNNEDSSIDDASLSLPVDALSSAKSKQTPIKLFNLATTPECTSLTSTSKTKTKSNQTVKSSLSSCGSSGGTSTSGGGATGGRTLKQNSFNYGSTSRRLSGRNLIKSLNEEKTIGGGTDSIDSVAIGGGDCVGGGHRHIKSDSANLLDFNSGDMNDDNSIESCWLALEQPIKLIVFESPVKRKCIIKNFRKPRFSQWKSYWLQLIAGNLLIYYPAKSMMFSRDRRFSEQNYSFEQYNTNNSNNTSVTSSTNQENSFYMTTSASSSSSSAAVAVTNSSASNGTTTTSNANSELNLDHQQQQQIYLQQLQNQLQPRKVYYNKNPCKMHPIANWMVVNLFQDKENEIIAASAAAASAVAGGSSVVAQSTSTSSQQFVPTTTTTNCIHTKFDIQLNDLNNGNMYKYRFDSLQLAKEWLEQFKLASTYHERQKPDNLIRFD